MQKNLVLAGMVAALGWSAADGAAAGSQGYVVSNWAPAMNNFDDSGCPEGKNADLREIAMYTFRRQGMSEAEIEKLVRPEGVTGAGRQLLAMRGRENGKPVNVYVNPLSVPDPNIKLDQAKEGFGFNLDGKVGPNDYTDPLTKETGVDNAAARVFGCFDRTRGTLEQPPGNWSFRWSHYAAGNSWLIEVNNNSDRPLDFQNDDDVVVTFYRGLQIPMLNASGYQRNVTYTIDPNSELKKNTSFKGRIRDGVFISDVTPQFRMIASSRLQPVFDFKSARMRIHFKPDGNLLGFVGGYLPLKMIYFPFGDYAHLAESIGSMDVPGVWYALQKGADTDIDAVPTTGVRTRISQTYQVHAVPAFLIEAPRAQAAKGAR